jgi:hypothetical protein
MVVETLLIGLVIALVWAELTDVSPGGLIVAGYFALYLDRPLRASRPPWPSPCSRGRWPRPCPGTSSSSAAAASS